MIRFATFNVAFNRTATFMLSSELALTRSAQDELLARLANGSLNGVEKTKALNVKQIRNVA